MTCTTGWFLLVSYQGHIPGIVPGTLQASMWHVNIGLGKQGASPKVGNSGCKGGRVDSESGRGSGLE